MSESRADKKVKLEVKLEKANQVLENLQTKHALAKAKLDEQQNKVNEIENQIVALDLAEISSMLESKNLTMDELKNQINQMPTKDNTTT